jgi:hypothetical protein
MAAFVALAILCNRVHGLPVGPGTARRWSARLEQFATGLMRTGGAGILIMW